MKKKTKILLVSVIILLLLAVVLFVLKIQVIDPLIEEIENIGCFGPEVMLKDQVV